jgi:hypothetical protein
MQRNLPLPIKEIITPPEFEQDYDLVVRVVEEQMLHSYVVVLFIASLILTMVVLF